MVFELRTLASKSPLDSYLQYFRTTKELVKDIIEQVAQTPAEKNAGLFDWVIGVAKTYIEEYEK